MNWLEHDQEVLKQCPFCGGSNVRTVVDDEFESHFGVKCFDCGGCIDAEKDNAEEAEKAWNKRHDLDRILEIIDKQYESTCDRYSKVSYMEAARDELRQLRSAVLKTRTRRMKI